MVASWIFLFPGNANDVSGTQYAAELVQAITEDENESGSETSFQSDEISTDLLELSEEPPTEPLAAPMEEFDLIPVEFQGFSSETIKVAADYTQFKSALEDSTTTIIYLDTDIVVALGGITINPAKASLIIDGTSPHDGTVHSITDYNSLYQYDTINLKTNNSLKSITLQNIDLYGKNLFGTVSIYDIVTNATVNYDKVRYYGPQPTYNRYGNACYKDSYFEIGKFDGISAPGELAEARNVIFEGNITVKQVVGQINEIIYSLNSGTVEVAPGADVFISTFEESAFFYGAAYSNFIVGEGASFRFFAPKRFWDGLPFRDVTINSNAKVYIEITSGLATTALLRVNGMLNVEPDSELVLINRGSSVYPVININGGSANFNSPKRVVLYSPGYRPLNYIIAGGFLAKAQQLRFWSAATPLNSAGGFDDIPEHHWNKLNNSNIEITGSIIAGVLGNFSNFSSNYNSEDTTGDTPLNSTSFNPVKARVIAFGRLPITAEYIKLDEASAEIIGFSEPEANIAVTFYDGNYSEITLNATADSQGKFIIPLDYTIEDGTPIIVRSNKMFLTSEYVVQAGNQAFSLSIASSSIEFETSPLSHQTKLVKRNNPDWSIVITDNRGIGSTWKLFAMLAAPFSYADDNNSSTLHDALIYIDDSGNASPLSIDEETHIWSHTTTAGKDITSISWDINKGILARIEPGGTQAGVSYEGSIRWILKDAP